jgi:hypothetical protein
MSFASLLVLTASLAAPSGEARPMQVERPFAVMFDEAAPVPVDQADRRAVPRQRDRRHTFGLGGSVAAGTSGAGGAFRYWFGDYVGFDLSAVWSRPRVTASARGTLAQVTPSVLVMLRPTSPGADFDIRPFVGGGLTWAYSSYPTTSARSVGGSTSGVGGQVYGGAEMVFADAPSLAISAEAVYSATPRSLYYGNTIDGFNVLLAFHYYFR